MVRFLVALFIVLCIGAAAIAAPDKPADWQVQPRAQIEARLTAIEASLTRDQPKVTVRNLPNGALAALFLGKDPKRAEALLRALFAAQNMDPQSPQYGSVPWTTNDPSINDLNSDEFSTQALGPILLAYGDTLSPTLKTELATHIRAFFVALKRRQMKTPSYTNIYVMRFVAMILMGEAIGDRDATDQGYRWFDEWRDYTRRAGIHEFDSPTYTAVDLNSLYLGYRFARRPGAREQFRAALDLFWSDICANYFAGRGDLAGPHSRDYDFVGGHKGGLGYYLASVGLPDDGTSDMIDFEKVYPLFNSQPGNYRPSDAILILARTPERIVRSRWDTAEARDRYNYVTPDFTLGGATGDYGSQDKLIALEFAGSPKLPVVCVTPELDATPYGTSKTPDRTGHLKATHLPLGATCVQEKGALLALLDIDLSKSKPGRDLTTSILLPARADQIVLNGKPVRLDQPGTRIAPPDLNEYAVLGIRQGNAGVAIRLVPADPLGAGLETGVYLMADSEGLKQDVAQLIAYHYSNPSGGGVPWVGKSARFGVIFLADRCTNETEFKALLERATKIRIASSQQEGVWTVSAAVPNGPTLEAVRDRNKHRVVSRKINGNELASFPVLEVNGKTLNPLER